MGLLGFAPRGGGPPDPIEDRVACQPAGTSAAIMACPADSRRARGATGQTAPASGYPLAALRWRPFRIAPRHARTHVLLDTVLWEGIAKAVFRQRLHAGDGFCQVVGWQGHEHFVVEHADVA